MATKTAQVLSASTSKDQALQWLQEGEITIADYKRWDSMRDQKALRCKVSEKGALSVYGLSAKWPTTLYAGQWERLIEFIPAIQEFIAANSDTLSRKD